MSSKIASSSARTKSGGSSWIAVTATVFCAVSATRTEEPWQPAAANAFRSAWTPAPPPESDVAIVRQRGTVTIPPFAGTNRIRFDGCHLSPAAAGHPGSGILTTPIYDPPMLDSLDSPWREVLLLGWEAYDAGTIPVGAVVVDEEGAVVARGRNRIFDAPLNGELAGSRLAHAEINALIGLDAGRHYFDWTLYSLLEPCPLCLGAAQAVRIGTVRYAASDEWGGAARWMPSTEDYAWHPVVVEGPLDHDLARFGELLNVAHFLWRVPDSNVATFYRRERPDLVAAAATLPKPRSGASLESMLQAL